MIDKNSTHAKSLLKELRHSIDNFDAILIQTLAERFRCTKKIGVLKGEYGMPPADIEREREQIKRLRQLAEDSDLDPDFAVKFITFITNEVIRHHEIILRDSKRQAIS